MVDLTGQTYFRFTEISAIGLSIDKVVGIAISGVVLTEADVAVGFSGLSLW